MGFISIIGISYFGIFLYSTTGWLVSLVRKESSVARVADVYWGLGFCLLAWLFFGFTDGYEPRKYLVCVLASLWGIRLAIYIVVRTWGKGEDPRYQTMRDAAGSRFWWTRYFQVFLLQGFIMGLIAAPLLASQYHESPERLTILDVIGTIIWVVGFLFETVSDWHLYLFKRDPKNAGKVLESGLWSYSRHPNYFGETLVWWGFFIIAIATPYGYWSIYGPLVITFLLLRVSGVTLLEKRQLETKPGYTEYVRKTSQFIPWFPRRTARD